MSGRVLVVGDVMSDVIVRPDGPIVTGSDRAAEIRTHPGGSGANQAVWLAAFDVPIRFAARVGAADRGVLEAAFAAEGVEPVLASDHDYPTGVLVTLLDPDGERSFLTDRGANLGLCSEDLPASLLDDVALVLVSGYSLFAPGPRAAVLALMAEARRRGLETALDAASTGFLAGVGVAQFLEWIAGTSLLFANADEAELLAGTRNPEDQMRTLGAYCETVVIKRGAAGAVLGGRDGTRVDLPGETVAIVDTTGAGDAFAAGFLAARLRGATETEQVEAGVAAGSRAVQHLGGRPV